MANSNYKGGIHNGFETLLKAIEELAGSKIDLSDI